MCFKIPEFVLSSFPHYSEKNSRRRLQKWLIPKKEYTGIDLGTNNLRRICALRFFKS